MNREIEIQSNHSKLFSWIRNMSKYHRSVPEYRALFSSTSVFQFYSSSMLEVNCCGLWDVKRQRRLDRIWIVISFFGLMNFWNSLILSLNFSCNSRTICDFDGGNIGNSSWIWHNARYKIAIIDLTNAYVLDTHFIKQCSYMKIRYCKL